VIEFYAILTLFITLLGFLRSNPTYFDVIGDILTSSSKLSKVSLVTKGKCIRLSVLDKLVIKELLNNNHKRLLIEYKGHNY
jgi:hypothetical protein